MLLVTAATINHLFNTPLIHDINHHNLFHTTQADKM